MLLLSCTNLSRGYDATPLFEDVSFEIHAGERVGFVGPNGAGKTTLLQILAGLDEPDAGKVTLHAGARLGLLQQVAEFPPGRTLFDEAKSAFDELLATQDEFESASPRSSPHATDEAERKQLCRQVRPAQRTAPPPRRLRPRPQGRGTCSPASASSRGGLRPRGRHLLAAASSGGCCSPSCCSPPRT